MADFFDIIAFCLPQPAGLTVKAAYEIYEHREEIAESEIADPLLQTFNDVFFALTTSRKRLLTVDKYPPACRSILCR